MIWFDAADLRLQAGRTWYARGLEYVDEVEELCWSSAEVTGTVRGTGVYHVRLWNNDGDLDGTCSCPWGLKGNFCKHCAAVGSAALAAAEKPQPEASAMFSPEAGPVDMAGIRAHLSATDQAELVALLVGLAENDPALRRRLSLRAGIGGFDSAELAALVETLRVRHCEDNADLARLCRNADDALRALEALAADHPGKVRPLYQRALKYLVDVDVDDAATVLDSTVARGVKGLVAVCRAAPEDPVELARWLLDLQLSASRFPGIAVTELAETLGEEGLAGYWQQLCDLTENDPAGDDDDDDEMNGPSRSRAIILLREKYLVDVTGDVDGLVALYAASLSNPDRYLRIGETLRAAGRIDDAIAWLRQGLSTRAWGHGRISDLLVELYAETGQHKEAAGVRWDNFASDPDEYNYRMLLRAAEPMDAVSYAEDRAMSHLRDRADRKVLRSADALVTILIAIGDIDEAWAAAHEYTCSDTCMFLLARNRAKTHPADAIPIFAREVDTAIGRKDWSGYSKATELLVALKDLHQRAGTDFATYLADIKAAHRRKTALMRSIADAQL